MLFLCLGTISSFPWKRGYFCSFLSVLLCFSLACLTSPFLSLSLLSFSCFLTSLFSVMLCFLVFCLSFLACFFASVSCKEQHQTITSERLFSSTFAIFLASWSFKSPFLIFTFAYGPTSPNPALLWCLCSSCCCFSFLCWFCVCCFCFVFVCIDCPKRASWPTIHLVARGPKIFLEVVVLEHEIWSSWRRMSWGEAKNHDFCSVFSKCRSCFWDMFRQYWLNESYLTWPQLGPFLYQRVPH